MVLGLLASSGSTVAQAIVDSISLGCLYALLALGVALIFGVMGLINFAYGELVMVGGYTAVYVAGDGQPLLVLAVLAAVVVFALATERLAFRPLRGAAPATLLVASFGLSIVLQNGAQMAFGSLPKGTDIFNGLNSAYLIGSVSVPKLSIVTVVATAALVGALVSFLRFTDLGVQMRAAAENFTMARLMGVRANRVIAAAFAISGVLAAVAAILLVTQTGTVTPTMGSSVVIVAFVATILGGAGSLPGAVLGGLLVGTFTVVLQDVLPLTLRPFRDAFVYSLVLAMLVARPQGLIVSRSRQQRV